jgi:RHS repeat-associated protein
MTDITAPPTATPRSVRPQSLPSISLPKGGGAIRGIGEKFAANPVTGTGALSVPIFSSLGRSGFGPELTLSYDSGSGNGLFGFGWHLNVPSITRKTDKGLPRYLDSEESDVFILAGAEDLVPVLEDDQRVMTKRIFHGVQWEIRPYRPRIEGLFARIERWTAADSGVSHWRVISRDNVTAIYGLEPFSSVVSPADKAHVFSWQLCRSFDDKGNVTLYEYVAEDGAGVERFRAHEANRSDDARTTQRFLKSIRYGNATPYFPDWSIEGQETALPVNWHYQVVFDYGDHDANAPSPQPDVVWPVRVDPFSTYRPTFEVRTYRRCQRVLLFHNFPAESVGSDCLVRSTDFDYSDQDVPADPVNPVYTFLKSVTYTAYRRTGKKSVARSLPPLEFEYSQPMVQSSVVTLDSKSLSGLPEGLDGARYQWVDLDGEGLSGMLSDAGGGWTYKRNTSPVNDVALPGGKLGTRARFAANESLPHVPSRSDLRGQRLMDLSGDGQLDVVSLDEPDAGFFERTEDRSWAPLRRFASLPDISWSEPNLKFIDLTGDGLADVLLTEDSVFTLWASLGADGFAPAERVRVPSDEAKGPAVVLADGTDTVFLADMSGDGLSDLVRVRNGEVCYWPSLGYGRFGPKVTMDAAPRFTDAERFDPRRIRLADVDGSGTTDLLYIGDDGVQVCFNRSGNSWGAPQRVGVFPTADNLSAVQVADLLGNGTACLVWSSPLPAYAGSALHYVDLMGGQKPHLLVRSRNNLGAETRVRYAPSTRFYLADQEAGRPWITRLPHVVHVVERVETYDWIGRSRFVTRYAYHHGFFDGFEREFRGFGMVEQWDTEEHRDDTDFPNAEATNWDATSWSPPLHTRTWFHTGAFVKAGVVTRQYEHEYWVEPALRDDAHTADREAMFIPDTILPDGLTAAEVREAYRALKGSVLRTEVYADESAGVLGNPYTVTEQDFSVRLLQSMKSSRHAVFFVHPREAVYFHYERKPNDPRVTHTLTLEVDNFGNALRVVEVGYPRRSGYAEPEPTLSKQFRDMLAYDQTRLHVQATANTMTNALADSVHRPDAHRAPLPAETTVAEITGAEPKGNRPGITNLFGFDELDQIWQSLWGGAHDVPYEDIPRADVDGTGTPAAAPTLRLVDQTRVVYRSDDLQHLLALGELQSHALTGDSYRLALTATQRNRVFVGLVTNAMLAEGGYVQLPNSDGWWMPTGRVFFSPSDADPAGAELLYARAHFYLPQRVVDPLGGISRVGYDSYDLLAASATDPVGNTTVAVNDYRVLLPVSITDPNQNVGEASCDTFGLVVATAVRGKKAELLGDSVADVDPDLDPAVTLANKPALVSDPKAVLASATSRMLYDVWAYQRTRDNPQPDPPVVYSVSRETHVSDLPKDGVTRYQQSFGYSDGFGREIQKKAQAEPGPLADGGPDVPRWVGTGWTIFNNKGKPVRKYEPFFSATMEFEFARQEGVSSVLFYDPADRVVATLHPNNTWEKVVFDPWRQAAWDVNDTVGIVDPRQDNDVGDYFTRLLGNAPNAFTSWHDQRIGGGLGPAEQQAAIQTEAHRETWTETYFDVLGRSCLTVADNGADGRYPTRTAYDTEGKPLAVFDALGRRVFEYCLREPQAAGFRYVAGTDVAGNGIYHVGMDGGVRRTLANALGKPIWTWDARAHAFHVLYDAAQRHTHRYVSTDGGNPVLLERLVYGEGQPDLNLCGRLWRHYDGAGLASNESYDFKGNLSSSARQLAVEYRQSVDWSALANVTDPAGLDGASAAKLVKDDRFVATTRYDALNRVIQTVTPHNAAMRPNVIRPSYNEANLLDQIDVWRQQGIAPDTLLDPVTADLHAVTNVDYNARGQQVLIAFGNGGVTSFKYDPATFRLTHLTTTRPNSFAPNQRVVQDLGYTYDPAGNITHIRDDADIQPVIFFQNTRIDPSADYVYDATYRLTSATGREHLGQTGAALKPPMQVANDDGPALLNPSDGRAMGRYTETYNYDEVGNILSMLHQVSSGSWTRRFNYAELSQITPDETNDRLTSTSLPGDPNLGPYSAKYAHDAHGNMTQMPHLSAMSWEEQDRLRSTARQVVNGGTPETTFYTYDAGGLRVRKVTNAAAVGGGADVRAAERIYLGAVELYRGFQPDGTTVSVARETLLVLAGQDRIAVVETRTAGVDPGLQQLVRFQYSNHLSSAVLELDDKADIISYEEFFPYGSTAYQAVRNQTDTPKRYRYTGKERDEESGLNYHGARYYAPWLGRWTSADPAGQTDALNLYVYVRNSPSRSIDVNGKWGQDMHFLGTYWTARAAGFEHAEARQVALGAQALDDISGDRHGPGMAAPSAKLGVLLEHWSRDDIMSGANFLHSLGVRSGEAEAITHLATERHDMFLLGIGLHQVEDLRPHANSTGIPTPGHKHGLTETGIPSSPIDTVADHTHDNPNLALNTIAHAYRIMREYQESRGKSAPATISREQRHLFEAFVMAREWDQKTKNETVIKALRALPGGTTQQQLDELFGGGQMSGLTDPKRRLASPELQEGWNRTRNTVLGEAANHWNPHFYTNYKLDPFSLKDNWSDVGGKPVPVKQEDIYPF